MTFNPSGSRTEPNGAHGRELTCYYFHRRLPCGFLFANGSGKGNIGSDSLFVPYALPELKRAKAFLNIVSGSDNNILILISEIFNP